MQLLRIGETNTVDDQIIYCNLLISDPGGDLIKVFLDMWNDLAEARDTRTLFSEELGAELES